MSFYTLTITALQLSTLVQAHYGFSTLVYPGATSLPWQHIRYWYTPAFWYNTPPPITETGYPDKLGYWIPLRSNEPEFNTKNMICNLNATTDAPAVLPVTAGSILGFKVEPGLYHPGPLLGYMARVPVGRSVKGWEADGKVWFKVYEDFPVRLSRSTAETGDVIWPQDGTHIVNFTIPKSLPDGEYLFRAEHIANHRAVSSGDGPLEFFFSCAQLHVMGGKEKGLEGMGDEYLTKFPGAYDVNDPIFKASPYLQTEKTWKEQPYYSRSLGPALWKGLNV